ncbi:MAG: hypothetical protein P4M11_11445 [Candidatus Pacebacteria bacterium]|nr:hypothetical protein [Candidatus Paceibacterota bacterium]
MNKTNSPVQAADLKLGQRPEAPNAPLIPSTAPTSTVHATVATLPLAPGCSLHFSFAPTANAVAPGGTINYSILLTNLGQDTCQNASFSVYYADNESFVSGAPKATADNYYWNVGGLASRQTYQVTLSTEENAGSTETQVQNEACATADNSSDVCADNLIFVQAGAPAMPAVGTAIMSPELAAGAAGAGITSTQPTSGTWGAAFASRQFGTWIWDSPITMTSSYEQAAIAAAAQNGFNTIYLTVDDYLPISQLPDGADKTSREDAYFKALNSFITQAKAAGISVYVEGGANDWGDPANRWKGDAMVAFIKAYDAAYPDAPIAGLQLDVESYLDPTYTNDSSSVIIGYLTLINNVTQEMENVSAKLSIVIPHFYDDQILWAPDVSFNGTTKYPYNHLLDILQQKPGSYLIVMAYRNSVTGSDGSEALADTEVKEADGYSSKVIVAQETGDVPPSYVTFYGLTKQDLYTALTAITGYFDADASFGGVAVHYLDPFLELK